MMLFKFQTILNLFLIDNLIIFHLFTNMFSDKDITEEVSQEIEKEKQQQQCKIHQYIELIKPVGSNQNES